MRCAPYRNETSRLHTDAHPALHISGLGVARGGASERDETVLPYALDDGLVRVVFDASLRRLVNVVEDHLEGEAGVSWRNGGGGRCRGGGCGFGGFVKSGWRGGIGGRGGVGGLSAAAALSLDVVILFELIEPPVVVGSLEAILATKNSCKFYCFFSDLVTGSQNPLLRLFDPPVAEGEIDAFSGRRDAGLIKRQVPPLLSQDFGDSATRVR